MSFVTMSWSGGCCDAWQRFDGGSWGPDPKLTGDLTGYFHLQLSRIRIHAFHTTFSTTSNPNTQASARELIDELLRTAWFSKPYKLKASLEH